MRRGAIALAAAVLGLLVVADLGAGNHQIASRVSVYPPIGFANPQAIFLAATADGSRVTFMVRDGSSGPGYIFQRTGGGTAVPVSLDQNGDPAPATFWRMSEDGSRILFETSLSITGDDLDSGQRDLYERHAGVTRLITTGPTDPHGNDGGAYLYFSRDLTHVMFWTNARLVAEDNDNGTGDVYQRFNGTTRLLSAPPGGSTATNVFAGGVGVEAYGSGAFFSTDESLLPEDGDSLRDIYESEDGVLRLVTDYSPSLGGLGVPEFKATSPDGSRVIITTGQQLDPADTDSEIDVYELSGGNETLLSTSETGGPAGTRIGYQGASEDVSTVWFLSGDQLTADDVDATVDLYKHANGTTTLVTTGPTAGTAGSNNVAYKGNAAGGARTYFQTEEQLVAADTDSALDVYERFGSTTTLISVSSAGGPQQAHFQGSAADGSRVFFMTFESLLPADTDTQMDVYERSGANTYLVTPAGTSPTAFQFPFGGVLPDGLTVYINTADNIGADTDGRLDAYATRVFDTGGYPRPKGATPVRFSLVPAAKICTAPDRTHGPPLAFGSCNPPLPESPNLTVGSGDGPGPANSQGNLRMEVIVGTPGGVDDSDVNLSLVLTNVMTVPALADYAGELRATAGVRLTDRDAGIPGTTEFELAFTVPCTPTADTTLGGDCRVFTSADAVVPGMVPEGTRAIWRLNQIKVFDGGPDGDAETAGNSLLAVQGIFVP